MPYKPMSKKAYDAMLAKFGWRYRKGGIDYDLLDENGHRVCTINFVKGKAEIAAPYVKKTRDHLIQRGFKP